MRALMGRRDKVLGIVFIVLGVGNAVILDERVWGILTGIVFLTVGITFLRRARLERG